MLAQTTAIAEALAQLQNEAVLLYPSDTIWGIGCDARATAAIERVYKLKQRVDSKALICLVSDKEMLERYVGSIPTPLLPYLEGERPTTIIYPAVEGISPRLRAPDGSVGIRIAKDEFCPALIQALGAPLVSTSANISGTASPTCYAEIDPAIVEGVDHVVPIKQDQKESRASRIIRLLPDNTIEVLRD